MPHILLCDGRCSLARGSMHPPIQFTPQEGFDSDTSFDWAFRDPVATKGFSASLYMPVRGVAWPTAFGEEIERDDKDLLMGEMADNVGFVISLEPEKRFLGAESSGVWN